MIELTCHRLTRHFPGGAGVADVSLQLLPGQVHALVGLNGAGKTTLMRLLLGMLRPDSGSITLNGCSLERLPPADWGRVGHLLGRSLAYPDLRVRTNLGLAARLHGVPGAQVAPVVEHAMEELNLIEYSDRRVRVLSAGNVQRMGLAIALQHQPELIVLDEPTNALDPRGTVLLREVLQRRAAAGATVLVSSHHLDEVARIAHRITVVNRGEVIGELDPTDSEIERAFFAQVLADDERSR